MLDRYIRNTFNRFYEKYKHIIHISREDRTVWLLLLSIMIFENYNRGGIIRKVERIKIFFWQSATVGIMQIKSSENITDEESIKLAYDKLKNEIMLADMDIDDEMQIKDYAFEYNHDEDYSKSVSFIYQSLKEYLSQDQKYKELFCLTEEDRWQESNENVGDEQEICYDMARG